jgi:hypothetical protein
MPEATTHHHVRAARDRVIDLLGLGETYPLQDPEIRDEKLTVPVEETAKIPIAPGQSDAEFGLYSRDEKPVDGAVAVRGTGGVTLLETPPIIEDVTYKVLARKLDSQRQAWLHETPTIKVGLDASLGARILSSLLDPRIENPGDALPRITDYRQPVEVEVDDGQEGVDYQLVEVRDAGEVELSASDVGGLGPDKSIVLQSLPLAEDTRIRIRATKTFDQADERDPQSTLLDIVLPLAVRADRGAEVTAGAPVIPFGASTPVTIAGSQESAEYRLWGRTLADADFVYGDAGSDLLRVAVEGQPDVQVLPPPDLGGVPEGYRALGEWQPGNGSDLHFDVGPLEEDTVVIAQARKTHWDDGTSLVQLAQAAVALVEPDPTVELALEVPVTARTMKEQVSVAGGDPGVFYILRRGATGADREPPAYFHQLDPAHPDQNKGVGLLRIEGDFVLARDPGPQGQPPEGVPPDARPPTPLLDFGRGSLDLELHVRAMKARTRVAAELSRAATVIAPPEIRLEEETVDAGSPARILVIASRPGDFYQPFLDGVAIKRGLHGNGDSLVFVTGPVTTETTFEVYITRRDDPGLAVTRIVSLTLKVQ